MAMDFDRIASELDSASLFDLYRLHVAVGKMLDDPARIVRVKYALRPGQQVTFLDERGQRLVGARVLQVKQTRATVEELATGKHWVIPLSSNYT